MNLLFLSLINYGSIINEHGIYPDLLREFVKHGHNVYSVGLGNDNLVIKETESCTLVKVKTAQIVGSKNLIKKGLATLSVPSILKRAIKKNFKNVKFDLVLYPTPPITLYSVVKYIKKRDSAKTYLLLKDIFPQNAVDLGMLCTTGAKSIIYKYFRSREKLLYQISDRIGCMSQANVDYVQKHNPEINPNKVEICPNSIEPQNMTITTEEKIEIRNKYGIPLDKKVFVYGGNLGKPQGIPFVIDCLKAEKNNYEALFLIVGDGSEYGMLEDFVKVNKPNNVKLLKRIPKDDYDRMIAACDVGLIFLDYRFTIPNFPSRLLAYMQAGLPVLACTDSNTDIGKVIVDNGLGWWCESNKVELFTKTINNLELVNIKNENINYCLNQIYSVEISYNTIINNF